MILVSRCATLGHSVTATEILVHAYQYLDGEAFQIQIYARLQNHGESPRCAQSLIRKLSGSQRSDGVQWTNHLRKLFLCDFCTNHNATRLNCTRFPAGKASRMRKRKKETSLVLCHIHGAPFQTNKQTPTLKGHDLPQTPGGHRARIILCFDVLWLPVIE